MEPNAVNASATSARRNYVNYHWWFVKKPEECRGAPVGDKSVWTAGQCCRHHAPEVADVGAAYRICPPEHAVQPAQLDGMGNRAVHEPQSVQFAP